MNFYNQKRLFYALLIAVDSAGKEIRKQFGKNKQVKNLNKRVVTDTLYIQDGQVFKM